MGNDNVKDYPPYLDYPNPRKPITNADRIRAMTDEELAEWIAGSVLNLTGGSLEMATEAWANWLKQEATDEA